ncbi:MAG: helix-turn-helix domain-containing protein [Ruminiclostridium sp.]|nr:helix-turn-helix domain-containing protein [Ruminiclostridium sp.]
MRAIGKNRYKLLITDIDPEAPEKYKRSGVLRECGFDINGHAMSQRIALRYVRGVKVDLVIFREKLPEMDSAAFTSELSAIRNAPVCIVIGSGDPHTIRECFLNGAVDYLTEPVSEQQIRDALQRAAENIRSTEATGDYTDTVREYFAELSEISEDPEFLKKIQAYITENEGAVVSTQDAAEHFGFNKDYFGRMFRKRMGMTFGEFYKRFRMRYAVKLLLSGRYKVGEISRMLGFATADYFTAEFHKYTGKRPLEVKNRK